MRKIKAIIIDDHLGAIDLLEIFLNQTNKVEIIKKVTNSLTAESCIAKCNPDVVFLDVNMPGQTGLQIIENIRAYNIDLIIVFVTAFEIHALEVIKHHAFDYLLKPIDKIGVQETVDKLYQYFQHKKEKTAQKVKLPIKDGFMYINFNEILYLEADRNYTHIILVNNERYLSSYNMGRLAKRINLNGFERLNRNLIANTQYLFKVNKQNNTCILKTPGIECELKVSNTFLQKMNKIL